MNWKLLKDVGLIGAIIAALLFLVKPFMLKMLAPLLLVLVIVYIAYLLVLSAYTEPSKKGEENDPRNEV